ncbi:GntR family transcriptional regulator [Jannaschia faecimaris]|uniref:GntR family transcriptional regulator n=1 Tax=Jannaschia faecimaris TaxID=1244108 RepID=UPI000B84B1EB|nr:FCD domain-containing protein [Jannaschia faecimaris]
MSDARATSLSREGGGTLTDAAYDALRVDIIRGLRGPGERLRIERLKALYGVGPTPLREALQRLSADGLVAASGNRGFSVASLDAAEFIDLNIARTALETQALRLSITNGDDLWEAGVVSAAYRMAKADTTLMSDGGASIDAWEGMNEMFHLAMVAACGSDWLLRVRKRLHDQCERYRRAALDRRRGARDLRAEHAAIADAVLARDVERALDLTKSHFDATVETLSGRAAR